MMLLTWNNLAYYQDLMAGLRKAIAEGWLEIMSPRSRKAGPRASGTERRSRTAPCGQRRFGDIRVVARGSCAVSSSPERALPTLSEGAEMPDRPPGAIISRRGDDALASMPKWR